MTKILIAGCKQEVATFNPKASGYHDFVVLTGNAMLAANDGVQTEVAGALQVFNAEPGLTVAPAYNAQAITSGGVLASADFERLAREFLDAVKRQRDADGIYFCLHGAMAAHNEDDPEGYLLLETRRIVGRNTPIVVSLDLHAVLTDRMLECADVVVPYHTYPHVDFFETGARAARLLLKVLRREVRPITAKVSIPALVRGDELITETGIFGSLLREAQRIEASPWGLAAGMFIGNPFTDVPALRSNSLVVTDGDPEHACQEAVALARSFWEVRARLQASLTSLRDAVEIAAAARGTVILADAADATSSGASGDINAILGALREQGYGGTVLAPIVDAHAVKDAFEAGVGNPVTTSIGGRLDPQRFTPLLIEARVRLLSDGHFRNESDGRFWDGGPTAVLQAGTTTVVATSRPVSLYDRSLFLAHGQDPQSFDIVIVKSPHCQPHFYAAWSEQVINVDAPGATSANLQSLGYSRCQRPMYPLDEDTVFEPHIELFTRHGGFAPWREAGE